MSTSQGDPRVLFVMNVALSTLFSAVVVGALSFIDVLTFGWRPIAALVLFVLTWLVTR